MSRVKPTPQGPALIHQTFWILLTLPNLGKFMARLNPIVALSRGRVRVSHGFGTSEKTLRPSVQGSVPRRQTRRGQSWVLEWGIGKLAFSIQHRCRLVHVLPAMNLFFLFLSRTSLPGVSPRFSIFNGLHLDRCRS